MASEDNGDMSSGDSIPNCPSSGSMYKSFNVADPYFSYRWNQLVSICQSENFGNAPMVLHNTLANSPYPGVLENHSIGSSSHPVPYPSDLSLVEMMAKPPCFESGNFSEMVGSFGFSELGQISSVGCPPNYTQKEEDDRQKASINRTRSQECWISEDGVGLASPDAMRKSKASETHFPVNSNKDDTQSSDNPKEDDEMKPVMEQNVSANLGGKQSGKQAKDASSSGVAPKETYIHIRAKRGQATNSHSLAERIRRERISERMRYLQELVPGCNKIIGKVVMLDEIINYVQSLQRQVEFLSMKLATVNRELNIDIDWLLSADILHSSGSNASVLGFGPRSSSSLSYPQGIPQGTLSGIQSTTSFDPMPQTPWNSERQNCFQIGFEPNSTINSLGRKGHSELE